MKHLVASVLTLLMLIVPVTASAKGETVRIEITGGTLKTPLEITTANVVDNFSIWTGLGVRVNGQSVYQNANMQAGAFIDWPKGTIREPPKGTQRYKVSFFCVFPRKKVAQLAYVVLYEADSETGRGYMYLPGRGDEGYELNVSSISHDFEGHFEGHWFYASDAWERLVRPLVEKAIAKNTQAAS